MPFDFHSFILISQIYSAHFTNSSNPHPSNKLTALTPISSNYSTYLVVQTHLEVLEEVPVVSFIGGQALILHHSIVAKLSELLLLVEQDARGCLRGLEPVLCSPVHLADLVRA